MELVAYRMKLQISIFVLPDSFTINTNWGGKLLQIKGDIFRRVFKHKNRAHFIGLASAAYTEAVDVMAICKILQQNANNLTEVPQRQSWRRSLAHHLG